MPLWVVGPVLASQDARDQDAAGRRRHVKIPEAFLGALGGPEATDQEEGERLGRAGDGRPFP